MNFEEETNNGEKHTWFLWRRDCIEVLDQRKLPFKEVWIKLEDENDVANAIKKMILRGAPAIGIAAAFGIVLGIKNLNLENKEEIKKGFARIKDKLLNTRPTAVNLKNSIDSMEEELDRLLLHQDIDKEKIVEKLEEKAKNIWKEDYLACLKMGQLGATLIKEEYIFTICNTGSLATGGWGTAFSVIRSAHQQGKKIFVFVCETRPYLQGARLTTWEMSKLKIPYALIPDSAASFVISKVKRGCVITGADRITTDGHTANKIGTLSLAISAKYFGIPFYVVAPTTTIGTDSQIPIEERDPEEVRKIYGKRIVPKNVQVKNYAFDITPPQLISAIVTEKGVYHYPYNFDRWI